eukprot:CAMPEP_0113504646 /NCGR_PEP_ID=MMETSP0014_2-20120614/34833_1 /TAXON_ID=2857 /ORGANISM="Nitzschia sp." /LENGTH=145 /DNA_ID=CAMNT_0000399783 /DNA_START=194 /DNA_END=631 /DNA_ORIENTATION=+ /assembly_acc=CAM_ASM_000159
MMDLVRTDESGDSLDLDLTIFFVPTDNEGDIAISVADNGISLDACLHCSGVRPKIVKDHGSVAALESPNWVEQTCLPRSITDTKVDFRIAMVISVKGQVSVFIDTCWKIFSNKLFVLVAFDKCGFSNPSVSSDDDIEVGLFFFHC